MQINRKPITLHTHEGATAQHINKEQELRRSVMSCLLWEKEFYEDGIEIGLRINDLVKAVPLDVACLIAVEARQDMHLRHVPLWIMACVIKNNKSAKVAIYIPEIIQRADELAEFAAMLGEKKWFTSQVKQGLAKAFTKFNAYQLAKYNRDNAWKLRDVLFLCHAKPENKEQEATWKQLIDGILPVPDTWEVALSAGKDKKETWERLLRENQLGGLALLRNLRNMNEAGVDRHLMADSISKMNTERILPFRFIAAARVVPGWEHVLETKMMESIKDIHLSGTTTVLVDVSGSMEEALSAKSDMKRMDAACGLAMVLREICQDIQVYAFSNQLALIPARHGFALRDAIVCSMAHGGTCLGEAIRRLPVSDRLIVVTDEQSQDRVTLPQHAKRYMINVASNQRGIGYGGWTHLDGFSEGIVRWIIENEK